MLTILICTYERGDIIHECLNSLRNQHDQDFELIIIDNGKSDETQKCVECYLAECPYWKYVKSKEVGLSRARNIGARLAKTEWVGYLDDDAVVDSDFISKVKDVIHLEEYDAFGGVYYPWYHQGRKIWFSDKYGGNWYVYGGGEARELKNHEYFSGGIAFYKKEVIEDAGWFNVELGMNGQEVAYGEETELQNNMRQNDCVLGIAPEVKMLHLVASYKLSLKWQLMSQYKRGGVYALTSTIKHSKVGVLLKMYPRAVRQSFRIQRTNYQSALGYIIGCPVEFCYSIAFSLGRLKKI